MSCSLGQSGSEVALTGPENGYRVAYVPRGSTATAIDGTLTSHYAAVKHRWTVPLRGMSAATKASLQTELEREEHLSWIDPEGGTSTVRVESSEVYRINSALWAADLVLVEE